MERVREVVRTIEIEGEPGGAERAFGWEVPLEARPGPRGPRVVLTLPFETREGRDRFVAAVDKILGACLGLDERRRLELGVARVAALSALAHLGDEDDAQAAEVELSSCLGDGELSSCLGVGLAEDLSCETEVVLDDILAPQRAKALVPSATVPPIEPPARVDASLRLTLDVEYETNGTGLDTLRANLEGMIAQALDAGYLTEDTPAEVSCWNVSVAALEPTTSMASTVP